MKPLAIALLAACAAALAACGSSSSSSGAKEQPATADTAKPVAAVGGDISSWSDADRFIGQRVSLIGRLGSLRGVHGIITTRGGLVVGLPNLDLHAPSVGWYDWLDRSVSVTGVLHAPGARPGGMKDFAGPTLEVEPDSFQRVD